MICEIVEGQDYIIEVSKTINNFILGNTHLISIDLLEEVKKQYGEVYLN